MISYHIYRNAVDAGPVDYSTPLATTAGLTFAPPALGTPSDNRFGVRAFDTVSGLEESNVDSQVHILIDPSGADVTSRPNAPLHLSARPTANGGARVEWDYATGNQGGPPTGFRVYLTAGGVVNFAAAPVATVGYLPGVVHYLADLSGLADEATYSIGVRSYNATSIEQNPHAVAVVGEVAGPAPVDDLTAVAGP